MKSESTSAAPTLSLKPAAAVPAPTPMILSVDAPSRTNLSRLVLPNGRFPFEPRMNVANGTCNDCGSYLRGARFGTFIGATTRVDLVVIQDCRRVDSVALLKVFDFEDVIHVEG